MGTYNHIHFRFALVHQGNGRPLFATALALGGGQASDGGSEGMAVDLNT